MTSTPTISMEMTLTSNCSEEAAAKARESIPSSGEVKGKADELSGQASGKASELAGEAKGKANEVSGQAKGKAEEVKGKL
jgi:hypothetical protein